MSANELRQAALTLELDADEAVRLARLPRLAKARLGSAIAEHIYTVYYDTPGHALRHDGLCLRLSHSGLGRIQTVRTESDGAIALDVVPLNGAGPDIDHISDPALRARVADLARDADLAPLFETRVLRLTRQVKTQDGAVIQLSLEQGEVQAHDKTSAISELTLELKTGDPAALYDVARSISGERGVRVQTVSKADLGYGLLGETPAAALPQKAPPVVLPKKATVRDALKASLNAARAHLTANEAAVLAVRDPEGVHQMRVALRRLRSVCAAFAMTPAGETLADIDAQARDLGRVLGRARDLDVFLGEVFPAAAEGCRDDASLLAPLQQAASEARAEAWTNVLAALKDPAYALFVLALAGAAERNDWPKAGSKRARLAASAKAFGADRLDEALEQVAKLARKLTHLSDKKRHVLRKRLKALRYTGEIFESLFPEKRAKQTQKRLSRLQDTFGLLNDVAVVGDLTEELAHAREGRGDTEGAEVLRRAAGVVVAWHQPRAEALFAEAKDRWRELAEGCLFWR